MSAEQTAARTTPARSTAEPSARVRELLSRMTLEEKLAQLVGYWVDRDPGALVAPMAGEMGSERDFRDATRHGIGHLTRVYGTRPVDPVERAAWLREEQLRLTTQTRLGIPALVHEEVLTGLAAWTAATFPTPLAWGAAFDPELVETMAGLIGDSMVELGAHQGLAPVLDVIRDPRWGRVDECISEDPYLVGTIGTAYVRGLQSAGVHATLKHFAGYSASRAGRNHAPVHMGPRELADVILPPFEMALREGGARSVMNSYAEIDGVPVGSDPGLLTGLLRDTWGFDGVVVADYFAVSFLETMHAVAADAGHAAELALAAGIDVELPDGKAYLGPLAARIAAGEADEALVDRAVLRVLAQKEELGLLDRDFTAPAPTAIDLDSPAHREVAARLAEESLVLLLNDGVLPLRAPDSIAVIGPNAERTEAMMGCYSFVNHVLAHHPEVPARLPMLSVRDALAAEFPQATLRAARGCEVEGEDRSGFDEAVAAARASEVAVVVLGDQAGLFGRGTVGEGNDVESLALPGVQSELLERIVATGTPVVVVLLVGRPYALDWIGADARPAAALLGFFPGEEGGPAIAGVLSGRVNPSGRLPVSLPRSAGAQPYSYLHPILGGDTEVTSASSRPALPFGHGLGYTRFEHTGLVADARVAAGASLTVSVRVRNVGDRAGADVVQLYGRDPVASVTRPVAQLLAYRRIELEAGAEVRVEFRIPPSRLAFSDRDLRRVVEPGRLELWVGPSVDERETATELEIVGDVYVLEGTESLQATSAVHGA
ncbi:MAG: glycoside hydrolase family 3 C-terminal domain-containing protein [Actinomycetales bacterium]|nr:glycoside hydrolase family 3 C-terminal domain-containing protein [Actinomycetales bacterium]